MSFRIPEIRYLYSVREWAGLIVRTTRRTGLALRLALGTIPVAKAHELDGLPLDEPLKQTLLRLGRREIAPPFWDAPYKYGGAQYRERIAEVATYCAERWPGDFLEIGCFCGETTRCLSEVAGRFNRRVIAVDPWTTGTQNCSGREYEQFLKNIDPYRDRVDIVRRSSLDAETLRIVQQRALAFALVDGLHTYAAALSDIRMVEHCTGFIAVDDVSYGFEVLLAMRQGAAESKRAAVRIANCREGYLCPKGMQAEATLPRGVERKTAKAA